MTDIVHSFGKSLFPQRLKELRLEDEYDLAVLRKAMEEDDGVRIPAEDLFEEFGI